MNEFYNPITLKTQNITVLITGATGYIGGRLISRLLSNNIKIRVLVRDVNKIKNKSWFNKVEIFDLGNHILIIGMILLVIFVSLNVDWINWLSIP